MTVDAESADEADTTATHPDFPLEDWRPLSESIVWSLEKDGYTAAGIDGWRTGMVPHYITTNPFIAAAYARVALAYLRDCEAAGLTDRPVTIVELGAGPGRFGYAMLRRLMELRDASRVRVPFRYVFADFVEGNVVSWHQHPYLKPLVEAGVLDFAQFDLTHDTELRLQCSGDVLAPGGDNGVGLVVANYVFDSVPQDSFLAGGRLSELRCRAVSTQPEPDLSAEGVLDRVRLTFDAVPVTGQRYADATANAVLEQYNEELADATIVFPTAALDCLDRLQAVFGGRLLLLSGDKGFHRVDDMSDGGGPSLVTHGSVFSLMVNFDAIGRWCELRGGFALHPDRRPNSLSISACAVGLDDAALPEVALAYHDAIETLSPDDYFQVLRTASSDPDKHDFDTALALLRFSGWDAEVFARLSGVLTADLSSASRTVRDELAWSLRRVWDNYFPIGERALDVPALLASAFFEMGLHRDTIEFLDASLELYGPAVETLFNLALCHYAMGEIEPALRWVGEAVKADPEFAPARSLRTRLAAEARRLPAGQFIAAPRRGDPARSS